MRCTEWVFVLITCDCPRCFFNILLCGTFWDVVHHNVTLQQTLKKLSSSWGLPEEITCQQHVTCNCLFILCKTVSLRQLLKLWTTWICITTDLLFENWLTVYCSSTELSVSSSGEADEVPTTWKIGSPRREAEACSSSSSSSKSSPATQVDKNYGGLGVYSKSVNIWYKILKNNFA